MSSIQDLENRLVIIENVLNGLKSELRVHKKLSVGSDIDKQVVIEDGKVDGRDVSVIGTALDDNTKKLGEHDTKLGEHDTKLGEHDTKLGEHNTKLGDQLAKINTINNTLTSINNTLTSINNTLTKHLTNKDPNNNPKPNPHKVTAAQVGALPITGGTIIGNIKATNVTATEKVNGRNGKFEGLIECKNLQVNNSADIYHNLYFISMSNSSHTPSIRFLNSNDGNDFSYEIYKDKQRGDLVIAPKEGNQVRVEIKSKLIVQGNLIGKQHDHDPSIL